MTWADFNKVPIYLLFLNCSHENNTVLLLPQLVLVAATRTYYHVPVFLQNDIGAIIKVQNRDGI